MRYHDTTYACRSIGASQGWGGLSDVRRERFDPRVGSAWLYWMFEAFILETNKDDYSLIEVGVVA